MLKKNLNRKAFLAGGLFFALSLVMPLFGAEKTAVQIYEEGVQLQNNENYYQAAQCFIEVVDMNPAYSDAWFRLADCSYRIGEYDLALTYLTSAEKYEKNKARTDCRYCNNMCDSYAVCMFCKELLEGK